MSSDQAEVVHNLDAEVQGLTAHWSPKQLLSLDGTHSLKVASIKGEFLWHAHPNTDELFYCVSGGPMRLELADRQTNDEKQGDVVSVTVRPGDLYRVDRGRRHRPVAENETGILMVERLGTVNTGDEEGSDAAKTRTVYVDEATT